MERGCSYFCWIVPCMVHLIQITSAGTFWNLKSIVRTWFYWLCNRAASGSCWREPYPQIFDNTPSSLKHDQNTPLNVFFSPLMEEHFAFMPPSFGSAVASCQAEWMYITLLQEPLFIWLTYNFYFRLQLCGSYIPSFIQGPFLPSWITVFSSL